MKRPFKLFSLIATALIAACSTNPMTGRSQVMLVPEGQVIQQALGAYKQEMTPYSKAGKLNGDDAVVQRVRAITDRLVAQAVRYRPDSAAWAWEVNVIDDPKTLNAFCLPGGKMAIYTGIIEKLKATDDEIAQVMGHEIGHALANHGAEKMSRGMLGDVIVAAIAGNNQNRQQSATLLTQMGWMLPNSREAETEADRIGIELAARAGYNPAAGAKLWQKMKEASGEKGRFDFLSTHPASEKRMEYLAALEPHMRPIYTDAAKNPQALPTRLAANVRDVTPGAAALAPPSTASALRPLSLVNPALEGFKQGEARLNCESCGIQFGLAREGLQGLHQKGDWERLAQKVMDIGYVQDISWHYLAAAAEGLGHKAAARRYYENALNLSRHKDTRCAEGLTNLCNGIVVSQAAQEALARLGR
ncbi:MAG: M48 family metallopeptidase [Betaproteobacteria bacterium]|nr:M48 family metallopeptidase [Betaproteobacteria bacterium]